jgi:hypothetical protein
MRRVSRGVLFIVAAACTACTGSYWLGGKRALASRERDGGGVVQEAGIGNDIREAGVGDHVLGGDVVLSGDDSADFSAGDAGACRIIGNGHVIRSDGTWTGHLSIDGCTIENLGSAASPAISLVAYGNGATTIEGTTFDGSGTIHVTNEDDSATTFRNNVILPSSTVTLDATAGATTPAFLADGPSTTAKVFQGNRIYRSTASFLSPNWLIGGSTDAESNLIVGLRAGLVLGASGLVVRGNYVHVVHYAGAGDEAAVTANYGTVDTLAEHNVFRGGTWVLRGFGGELRYNAIIDAQYSAWLNQPFENTKVHHNLFFMCAAPQSDVQAGIYLVNDRAIGIEVYNNTLDGGGADKGFTGAAIAVDNGCFLSSLRSNLIFDFPFQENDGGAAAVRPGLTEGIAPPPARLGYADYNLFYNPDASPARNYGLAVSGLTVRVDAGFGEHDATSGGPVDQQVNPGALGVSGCFPWSDDDIENATVTMSTVLAALRAGYSPATGSAPLGAGDPADGTGNYIGAIGDGTLAQDLFGTFGH